MNETKNLFENLSDEEIRTVYKQYKQWCKSGYINGPELEKIRDQYVNIYNQSCALVIMERDLLMNIADRYLG